MNEAITAKKVVTHPYFAVLCALSLFFILPRYGGIAVMIGCASLLSVYVAVSPDDFRSRNGSLTAAICLAVTLWLAAVVIAAMTLMGEIEG